MPRAADDELGVFNKTSRNGREAVETVLADADEREPTLIGCAHVGCPGLSACAS
jgi:hypothetical protein